MSVKIVEVVVLMKKKIGDLSLSKKAEFCNNPSGTPCPKSCKFLDKNKKCKLVEKKYQDQEIEVEE